MVFVPVADSDESWRKIADATRAGRLGEGAKCATAKPNPHQVSPRVRAIMIYTRDWADKDDVRRVLKATRELGFRQRLSYKTDDATLSGRYGQGTAFYVAQPGSDDFEDRSGLSV